MKRLCFLIFTKFPRRALMSARKRPRVAIPAIGKIQPRLKLSASDRAIPKVRCFAAPLQSTASLPLRLIAVRDHFVETLILNELRLFSRPDFRICKKRS